LGHFLNGDKSLREIILKRRYGINLIAGASTIEAMTTLNPSKASRVLKQFGDMESELDFLIVDMPPGTEQSVLSFMASTSRRIIVVRNDQAGVTDAYAMIKVLCSDFKLDEIHIIVNGVSTEAEGKKMFDVLDKISQRFLTRALHYLGSVSQDELIVEAGLRNFSVTEYAPTSRGARDFRQIAAKTSHLALQKFVDGGIEHFIQRLLHLHDLTLEAA
ncbi:MAG: P-loop NTPase, partial [Rhodoferax sp.]|nr:P-loop NTPase [Rhodoferax sp.]